MVNGSPPVYVRHKVKGHLEGVRSNPMFTGPTKPITMVVRAKGRNQTVEQVSSFASFALEADFLCCKHFKVGF